MGARKRGRWEVTNKKCVPQARHTAMPPGTEPPPNEPQKQPRSKGCPVRLPNWNTKWKPMPGTAKPPCTTHARHGVLGEGLERNKWKEAAEAAYRQRARRWRGEERENVCTQDYRIGAAGYRVMPGTQAWSKSQGIGKAGRVHGPSAHHVFYGQSIGKNMSHGRHRYSSCSSHCSKAVSRHWHVPAYWLLITRRLYAQKRVSEAGTCHRWGESVHPQCPTVVPVLPACYRHRPCCHHAKRSA